MYRIIAQIASENSGLLTYGPMGIMCAWLMLRAEKIFGDIRSLSHRIDGLTRALLMDLVSRDTIGPATKEQARQEIAKIEARMPR